jgi:hypothetical protein
MKAIFKNTGILILLVWMTSQTFAQVNVVKISGDDASEGKKGLVYNLPRTRVHIHLCISKSEFVPGPLAAYASDYLGINGVSDKALVEYEIKSASVRTSVEPDPDQYYLVQKEEKSSGEIWISFGHHSPVNLMERFAEGSSPNGFGEWNSLLFQKPDAARLFRKYTESPSREIVDTIIRKASIDTIVIEDIFFKHSMVEYTDKEKAQEAADKIRQIENDRYNLLIGYQETAYSRDVLEFMLSSLENQRSEYVRLFTGITLSETLTFEYTLLPDPANEEGVYSLAGFNRNTGITEPNGQNVIKVIIGKSPGQERLSEGMTQSGGNGFAYRIPVDARIVVTYQEKELESEWVNVLQLSPVLTLPSDFKRIEFDPETGALRSVVIE